VLGSRPATGSPDRRPTGVRGGPAYRAAAWLGTRETKLV